MVPAETKNDPLLLGLEALTWTLAEDGRAMRLLALTGLSPDDLRGRAGDTDVLAAVLRFLCAHEPDLIACADAIGVQPAILAAAAERLEA